MTLDDLRPTSVDMDRADRVGFGVSNFPGPFEARGSMRRFRLRRDEDVSGLSGKGHVAEGVQFWDGTCALRWRTEIRTITVYNRIQDLHAIHTHGGASTIEWMDRCVGCRGDFPDLRPDQLYWNAEQKVFLCAACYEEARGEGLAEPW